MSKSCEAGSHVVCLMVHGMLGSATLFRQKTGAIRKLCKGVVYEYVDAPISIDSAVGKDSEAEKDDATRPAIYAWFRHTPAGPPEPEQPSACSSTACWTCQPVIVHEFELGLSCFRRMVREINPACILCFSQGATVSLAAILLDLLDVYEGRRSQFKHFMGVHSIILASPWVPHPCQRHSCTGDPKQGNALTDILTRVTRAQTVSGPDHRTGVELPFRVLVVYGRTDSVTPPSGIDYLRSVCPFFRYVEHPNGHIIPTTEPVRTALRGELESAKRIAQNAAACK